MVSESSQAMELPTRGVALMPSTRRQKDLAHEGLAAP